MSRYDVAVVGAGPAGAWTAFRLASAGAHVALFDPSHPREKPCGGGLTGRALRIVSAGLSAADVPGVRVTGAVFTHRQRHADIALTDDDTGDAPLVVASRREFDSALLGAACRAGACHLPIRVTDLRADAGGWTIATRDGTWSADWLVGADGTNSLVRRHVARPFSRADLSIAAGYFVHGRSSEDIAIEFEDAPPGYLWSFPRPSHLAVGACAQADQSSSSALFAIAERWIARHAAGARDEELQRYGWPIPSLGVKSIQQETPSGRGWMLVGDAAGLVDPITREGIYFALESGGFAADALLAGEDAARRYAERVRRSIHGELLRAARLRARFYQPHFTALLVSALGRSGRIRAIMADLVAGRQTYEGLRRRLLKTLEWRLMLELFGY